MRPDQPHLWAFIITGTVLLTGCAAVSKGRADLDLNMKERGTASWYGDDFHGSLTASGEPYDMHTLTAAHRTLPLGTLARITNVVNGKHVVIQINDRGPYVNGRILDLSYAAANALGMLERGVSPIQLEVVGQDRVGTEVNPIEQGVATILPRRFDTMPLSALLTMAKNHSHGATARIRPTDILRERRTRRVGDVTAAQRRAERQSWHRSEPDRATK
jgi:rare lipoprotein A